MDFTMNNLVDIASQEQIKLPRHFWNFWYYYWNDPEMTEKLSKSTLYEQHVKLWNKLVFLYTVKYPK
jgi:hypothetical protein